MNALSSSMALCVSVEAWLGKLFPLIEDWNEEHRLSQTPNFEHDTEERLYTANLVAFT